MSLLRRWIAGLSVFAAGYLLHAWSPWVEPSAPVRTGSPLLLMDYREVANNPDLEKAATEFFKANDHYPVRATENLLAVLWLHERYGEPSLAGFQITSYAERYIGAQGILAAHLLKDAPDSVRKRYEAIKTILNSLNEHEAKYHCLDGGSGCWRDRRIEHIRVVDAAARWALRLAKQPDATNSEPRKVFEKFYRRLSAEEKILRDDPNNGPEADGIVYREGYLKSKKTERDLAVKALDDLCVALRDWPPEMADELASLVLQTFQN